VPDLRLSVGGRDYGGWKTVRVTRGIESVAGSFELGVSDRWAGQDPPTPWPIAEEDECALTIDGVPVITGYVDRRSLSYGPEEHTLSVGGRDRTGNLVDCSAVLTEWEFQGISLLTLAQRLAKPFGVKVTLQAGLTLPRLGTKLTVDPGDTAFDALERACRMAGVLPVSDGAGGLLLTRAGSRRATTALVEGANILAASGEFDGAGRFRKYIVRGQRPGTSEDFGLGATSVTGTASDQNVRRSERVLIVRAEQSITPELARKRAEWEATIRAGRADAVSVTVQGWTQGDGSLWPVNALVPIESPYLGVKGEMLITQAVHSLDDRSGTKTDLSLKRPDAFVPAPVVPVTGAWKVFAKGVPPLLARPVGQ
jgi:prophage tail gpP-like protein